MGIAHIEDVPPRVLLEALDENWTISEKFDGSAITCGLDDDGVFYSARKGGENVYHVDDWPARPWANAFRQAHVILEMFIDEMKQIGQIQPGFAMNCEIINGTMPNTLTYVTPDVLVITYSPVYFNFDRFITSAVTRRYESTNGLDLHLFEDRQCWKLIKGPQSQMNNPQKFKVLHQGLQGITQFLHAQSPIEGLSNLDLLEIKLNRRPENVKPEEWKTLKEKYSEARDQARIDYLSNVKILKSGLMHQFLIGCNSELGGLMVEGLVIKTDGGKIFKVVDRESFTQMNKFAHRIKYWLVGGARPPKPCFLSRTKNWSKEQRLKRLEVLRVRYIKHRHNLSLSTKLNNRNVWLSYRNDLHQRTLNLFADIREGIINGR